MAQFPFLDSLEITGFRAFTTLKIPRLGRVNLIVGKNNVGKSSLLEALRLYASNGSFSTIRDILESRDEGRLGNGTHREGPRPEEVVARLFHRMDGKGRLAGQIAIGKQGKLQEQLIMRLTPYRYERLEDGRRVTKPLPIEEALQQEDLLLGLFVKRNGEEERTYILDGDRPRIYSREDVTLNHHFIGANGLSQSEVSLLWDTVSLTKAEEEVLRTLRIILPELERVGVVGAMEQGSRERVPVATVVSSEVRIPLRSLGEGMNRLLGLALGLVSSANGLLLIDEIESGLHYSVQPEIWKLIFEAAKDLNIQVFATTHSLDCINAFQEASSSIEDANGVLIRLEKRGDQIGIFEFEQDELTIAREHEIEIR